ncbi:MAG: nucleotidyltransferase domain-containing protein [archaeon]|jgi:predicted nucleotidyltransferase
MLEKLFTSKTRLALLKTLLFNDGKDYHVRALAKIVGITPTLVSKELNNLYELGIVNKEKKANLVLYSINSKCSFIKELKQIYIKTDYLGNTISEKLKDKVEYAVIFGSFAKGTENSKSDIDLLIVSDKKQDELYKIIFSIEKEIKREINSVLWSELEFSQKFPAHHLIKDIMSNNIIMLVGNENDFRRGILDKNRSKQKMD